jgi:hypothetical protein
MKFYSDVLALLHAYSRMDGRTEDRQTERQNDFNWLPAGMQIVLEKRKGLSCNEAKLVAA